MADPPKDASEWICIGWGCPLKYECERAIQDTDFVIKVWWLPPFVGEDCQHFIPTYEDD